MNYYNLYYKERKINNRPLTEEQVSEVLSKNNIFKRNQITNKLESISTNKIKIIKTIVI